MGKSIEEILIKVGREYGACRMKELNDRVISQAKQDIKEALLKEMPKEDDKQYGLPTIDAENRGCNVAIEKCLAVIDKLFG